MDSLKILCETYSDTFDYIFLFVYRVVFYSLLFIGFFAVAHQDYMVDYGFYFFFILKVFFGFTFLFIPDLLCDRHQHSAISWNSAMQVKNFYFLTLVFVLLIFFLNVTLNIISSLSIWAWHPLEVNIVLTLIYVLLWLREVALMYERLLLRYPIENNVSKTDLDYTDKSDTMDAYRADQNKILICGIFLQIIIGYLLMYWIWPFVIYYFLHAEERKKWSDLWGTPFRKLEISKIIRRHSFDSQVPHHENVIIVNKKREIHKKAAEFAYLIWRQYIVMLLKEEHKIILNYLELFYLIPIAAAISAAKKAGATEEEAKSIALEVHKELRGITSFTSDKNCIRHCWRSRWVFRGYLGQFPEISEARILLYTWYAESELGMPVGSFSNLYFVGSPDWDDIWRKK